MPVLCPRPGLKWRSRSSPAPFSSSVPCRPASCFLRPLLPEPRSPACLPPLLRSEPSATNAQNNSASSSGLSVRLDIPSAITILLFVPSITLFSFGSSSPFLLSWPSSACCVPGALVLLAAPCWPLLRLGWLGLVGWGLRASAASVAFSGPLAWPRGQKHSAPSQRTRRFFFSNLVRFLDIADRRPVLRNGCSFWY